MPTDSGTPSSPFLERKLSTILSADVAEFSRLMSEDEEQTLRIFRGHKKIFEALVATHRGRVFNTAGDAILAEFPSAVEAVRCATDIQSALRTRNDQLPPNRQVRFRIGINLGDVMVQGQDLLGDGVNIAARLQTAADPGGICISGSVHDQIRNKLSMTFQALGERTYKNIAQPVRTFSVLEAENGASLPSPKPPATKTPAVMFGGVAAVILLLLGCYLAYTHNKTKTSSPTQAGADSPATQPGAFSAAPSKGEEASLAPLSVQPAVESAASLKEKPAVATPAKHSQLSPKAASAALAAASSAAGTSGTANTRPYDGVFEGPVCFEETPKEARRCFHGLAVVKGSEIKGKWPMGQDTGITMFLQGEVSSAGEFKMEMHSEKSDGGRIITADFTGSIQDRHLDGIGKLRMGRPATIHWHKSTQLPAAN